ncbi:hypothetical protein OROHE_025295 [Orobanche hederae]
MKKQHATDYNDVVVGSGYGGSVVACRPSMAGFKVCLFEKGRKWEAKDFPTNSFIILSAFRLENSNLGINFGPQNGLFKVEKSSDEKLPHKSSDEKLLDKSSGEKSSGEKLFGEKSSGEKSSDEKSFDI